jgi:hypothetical protein
VRPRRALLTVLCVHRLDAHTDTVSTVAATSNLAATGGWDNTIHLWRWPQLIADAALGGLSSHMSAKKQATEAADEPSAAAASAGSVAVVTESAAALQGHAQVHFHLRYCSLLCCIKRGFSSFCVITACEVLTALRRDVHETLMTHCEQSNVCVRGCCCDYNDNFNLFWDRSVGLIAVRSLSEDL